MRLLKSLALAVSLVTAFVPTTADSGSSSHGGETHKYESDIARLRSLVIHSLYSHKDVFLRELLSNANDALEKLRITALTDREVMSAGQANITIDVVLDEGGNTGKLLIRDTGIGMTKDELARNLGTIARSGTNEFLKRADESEGAAGNLIGQFGLGFYSCFLVSPTVRVSSLPPASSANPNPEQYTFVSSSSGDSFEVFADPRGNTLGRGTEIELDIREDEREWLSTNRLKQLIDKHSQFATTFPIYIKERNMIKRPGQTPVTDDDDELNSDLDTNEQSSTDDYDLEESWIHVNDKAPIWMREPKQVADEEYREFYKAVSKEPTGETLGWSHFKGDTGSGVSYRALMYIPKTLPQDFWQKMTSGVNNVRLMVKRVFITDDLGEEYMPRWLSFLKVVVDADDLPLNVSRETLQNHRFLSQLQRILVRKAIDLFTKLAKDDPKEYKEVSKLYGNALRIGMIESKKDHVKIAKLLRFESTRSEFTSLEEYVENRKEGQKQIYYIAGVGEKPEALSRSPFVEKLKARGYEVLLLGLPSDEPMMSALDNFMGMRTQDVSKKGLQFGDEGEDAAEQAELAEQQVTFKPLLVWLKKELGSSINDVVLTNRLVSSPCTIVVDSFGWSANMARIMAAQPDAENDPMFNMMKNLPKNLEINPKSPLIEGLLERVKDLEEDEEDAELGETVRVLFDTTLVRSGFSVADPTTYFERVEALLRRSIGVSLSAKSQVHVRPAPPTAHGPLGEEGVPGGDGGFEEGDDVVFGDVDGLGDGIPQEHAADAADWADWRDIKKKMEADGKVEHDEL